ncbi:MAG TPA: fibronectin type III domain-containing protein [Thermoanaerobaculia bacterium]|nr:fibronectin type III domain-containing protein [Thermoanaerobaculia bacterium]
MRRLISSVAFAAVLAAGGFSTQAAETSAKAELHKRLLPVYLAVKGDRALLALDPGLSGQMESQEAVDRFLKAMPLSPLEYLQIDMEMQRYEIAVPSFMQELHVRWIEINEATARDHYGDALVDALLTRWPVNTGEEIVGGPEATVSTNKNVGSTSSPAPTAYDGEIQIAVNHRNTNQIVAAANTWNTTIAACNNNQTQSIFYSSDGGTTWGVTCAPSNNVWNLGTCTGTVFGSDPALYWNDNNEVFLNYMLLCGTASTTKYSMVVARSTNGGATWTAQGVIKNSWSTTDLEDKNFYVIDNTLASPFYGRHYTCWDRNNNEKFAYSTNNGVNWTEVDLPTAPVGGVDLACEIAVQKNGTVHVVWDSLTCGASTCSDERMWYTRSTNGGVSWSTPVQVRDFNLVGFSGANKPPVADNRGISPFGAVDVDNSGGACDGILYATFSDWTSGGATETDVWVSRSTNNGATWQAAVKVNDDGLAARTQFHPFLQVDQSNGSVVVFWHDARNDSVNRKVDYYVTRSTDCGLTFEANTKVSQNSAEFNNSGISYTDENTTDNPNRNPNQYGEYLGLDVKNGKAYMAWVDSRHFYPGSSTNAQKENVGFAIVDFGAACTPPAAPTGLTATAVSSSQINLSWTAVSGATSYNVYRSTVSGGPYTNVGSSATTTFSNTGLTGSTTYFYVVRAVVGCESGNSNQASATTQAPPPCTTQTLYNHNFDAATGLDGFSVGTFLSGGTTTPWRGVQTCTAASGTRIFRYGGTNCTANYTNNNFNFAQPNGAGGITIPAGATTVRLNFKHRRRYESGFDGGTLAVSTNGTNYTFVPGSAILAGSYNGTVSASCPPAGSAGTAIWTGVSTTFTTTTVDLDAACNAIAGNVGGCAGKAVRVGFTSITDCSTTDDGWFLDDVTVTACVP